MATGNQMATALLTEHFRYTPLTLLDDIINTVNALVFHGIDAIEKGLTNAPAAALGFTAPPNTSRTEDLSAEEKLSSLEEAKEAEIASGVIQLETLLNSTVDKDFDKFEIYVLRNILAVGREEEGLAPWVTLEHYRDVDLSATESAATAEAVQLARRKLLETRKLNAMLKAEEARNAAVLAQVRGLVGSAGRANASGMDSRDASAGEAPLAFLLAHHTHQQQQQQQQQQPLSQTLQTALQHLPALRANLAELKASLHSVPQQQPTAPRKANAEQDESEDAKRRRYLESRTRRALERKGLDVDHEAGTSAGGAGAGLLATMAGRRRVGREEVEGLERIVGEIRAAGDGDKQRRDNQAHQQEDVEMDDQ